MNFLFGKIIYLWVQIRNLYLLLFKNAIVLSGYVDAYTFKGIRHRNWGDDLNYYWIELLTNRPVVIYQCFWLARKLKLKNYLCIGTLLDSLTYLNKSTIVWGSGISSLGHKFEQPKRICSVRGYKTKEYLKAYGIECPNIIGDPALLLPIYYMPKSADKKYRLGLIPHITDLDHQVVQKIREKYPEILIIDLAHYKKWTDVIDEICSCEVIASSSLHGLITSDTYGVPNCWIKLGDKVCGGLSFKFLDYFSSVGRTEQNPWIVENVDDLMKAKDSLKQWKKPVIDTDSILKSCPFIK